jgi:outer membrane receptor protein involved in Fe transport
MKLTNTLKSKLFLLFTLASISFSAFAQKGEIRGTVVNAVSGKSMDYVAVSVIQNGLVKGGAYTGDDGSFVIKPLEAGMYELHVKNTGFNEVVMSNISVGSDGARIINEPIKLEKASKELKIIKIVDSKPLIDVGKPSTGKSMDAEAIKSAPVRDINSLVGAGAGNVYQKDGGGVQISGARENGTRIIVDGVPLRSGANIPTGSIAGAEILTGGLPAKYSDAVGGVINVTTKGGAKTFSGNGEFITSQYLDAYGYYLGGIGLTGPLLFRKEAGAKNKKPLLGYNINVEFQHDKDHNPSSVGVWKVKDEKLAELEKNPLKLNPNTGFGYIHNADYVTKADMEHIKAKQNAKQDLLRVAGKLDFNLNSNFSLAIGGNYYYNKRHDYIREYSLFNSQNNPEIRESTWRVFAKFTHHIGKTDSASLRKAANSTIQNAYYTVQVDYSRDNFLKWDDTHKKNAFNYGYVGKFNRLSMPTYTKGYDSISDIIAFKQNQPTDTLLLFEASNINQTMSNYASQYFSEVGDVRSNIYNASFTNLNLTTGGEFINGHRPSDVNGLWYNTGRQYPGYEYNQKNQFRLNIEGSLDVKLSKSSKPHAIEFGLLYEQRVDRSYNLSAVALWNLMRLYANRQIDGLDYDNPIKVFDNQGVFQDTIRYNVKYIEANQFNFDRNLRKSLGYAESSTNNINIDALDPSQLNVGMFSADELFNNGNLYVNYSGYDYTGKVYNGNPTYRDFFTKFDDKNGDNKKQANENYFRNIGAFRPIYSAAYIQDNFIYKDLHFNVGLRVDRFDANTQVLKDPYSLYATYSLDDVKAGGSEIATILKSQEKPTNISGSSVVYVDDKVGPTKIIGYRNGDTWYDAKGVEIKDANVLAKQTASGSIQPYLRDNIKIQDSSFVPESTFKDYTPQTVFEPRLNFSFPINGDDALFYAHYDIYAQRPQSRNFITPDYYLYLDKVAVDVTLPNPNLKPERTISYQIGFQQKLNAKTALKLSSFYREFKDLVQYTKVLYADPISYTTYGNRDFATVKGFEVQLEQQKSKNFRLTTSYTLAFADGSGSDDRSQKALVDQGQPNLRTIMPLSYDIRHTLGGNFDFHFGDDPSVPKIAGKNVLTNAGINLIFRARSGEPFTREGSARDVASITSSGTKTLAGTINGSRLPWNYKFDLKIDKDFAITTNKKDEGGTKKKVYLNVYLSILNLLNTKNIQNVYSFTGNANDDGYIGSPTYYSKISSVNSVQGFVDQYSIKANNPDNYSLPRRIRLGVQFNF